MLTSSEIEQLSQLRNRTGDIIGPPKDGVASPEWARELINPWWNWTVFPKDVLAKLAKFIVLQCGPLSEAEIDQLRYWGVGMDDPEYVIALIEQACGFPEYPDNEHLFIKSFSQSIMYGICSKTSPAIAEAVLEQAYNPGLTGQRQKCYRLLACYQLQERMCKSDIVRKALKVQWDGEPLVFRNE